MNKLFSFLLIIGCSLSIFSQESYYDDVDLNLTGLSLKQALATKIISSHTRFLTYDQIWDASQATDLNPENSSEVLLVYGYENGTDTDVTNDRARDINAFSGSSGDWNREHIFSRSLGTPNLGEAGPGSDAHHLRPADVQTNSSRGNRKFSDSSGNSGATPEVYIDPLDGTNSSGWYPGDEWKGDVARMMMYMYLRYDDRCLPSNIGLGSTTDTPDDMIDLFLQWNAEDPVSDFEKNRNSYHENTQNLYSQGNRNPFIDNPRLATRIWGGTEAEDLWGIYSSTDTEAPTTPTNLMATNTTTFSVELSWDASTDNVGVTSYDVYVDDVLTTNTTSNSSVVTDLDSNTSYSFSVIAKDIVNNESPKSSQINVTTLQDLEAPSVPTNVVISNQSGTSFIVSWDSSTDNTAVTSYDIYLDNNFIASTSETSYTVSNLDVETTYQVQILAKDKVDNASDLSIAVSATTTDGSTTTANELFFSEYFEGSFGTNKALEIANVTTSDIDLSVYSIKRQSNGGQDGADWSNELVLSGTLKSNEVYVIINSSSSIQELIDEADFVQPNNDSTNYGAPINFNGNDPVGLFKNGVLIDIIGVYNGGSSNFAEDVTLRRKSDIVQPNTNFDISNEWDEYSGDIVDNIGTLNTTLSTESFSSNSFQINPNPIKDIFTINNKNNIILDSITIYNTIGKKVMSLTNSNYNISELEPGIYFVKISSKNQYEIIKILKK
ncbi:endonuclease [Polaribacter sp.]|nr:endonuclease [Polaribacter sp.]